MIQRSITTFFLLLLGHTLFAGPDNIAVKADVTASTILNREHAAENVIDGIIGIGGKGEWACEGITTSWGHIRLPWIKLQWQKPQVINRVVLYDRPSPDENIAGAKLLFSDGSIIWVNQIPGDGTAKAITFEAKTVEWITIEATDGSGKDLGFSEIEVFPAFPQLSDYVSLVDPYPEHGHSGW
jgi:hypothetical protein